MFLVFAVLLSNLAIFPYPSCLVKLRPTTPATTTQKTPNRVAKLFIFSSILHSILVKACSKPKYDSAEEALWYETHKQSLGLGTSSSYSVPF